MLVCACARGTNPTRGSGDQAVGSINPTDRDEVVAPIVHVVTVGVASAAMTRVPTAIAIVRQHCTILY